MTVWFEGEIDIDASLPDVIRDLSNLGNYHLSVVGRMPGISTAELQSEGEDAVSIRTNEGNMTRTNITKTVSPDGVIVEFDEEYVAGKIATVRSHYFLAFDKTEGGVSHRLVLSNVRASGILGFFYRIFGKSSIGKATLKATKSHLEK